MKKIFLIFSMVFLGIQGYAQKTDGQGWIKDNSVFSSANDYFEYYDFIKSSIDFYGSYDYNINPILLDEFIDKVMGTSYKSVCAVEDFEVWIKEHLSETKFTSVEEAVMLFEENRKASEKIREQKNNLSTLESEYTEKYGEDFMENYTTIMTAISVSKRIEIQNERNNELKKGTYTALNN